MIYTLKSQGFEAKGFERPSHFWKAMEKEEPALLLLDVMLPEEDGISILKNCVCVRIHVNFLLSC